MLNKGYKPIAINTIIILCTQITNQMQAPQLVLYYTCRLYKGYKSSNTIYFCTNAGYKGYKPVALNTYSSILCMQVTKVTNHTKAPQ